MIAISEVDPGDDLTLRAFWETEQEWVWHDREFAIPRSWVRLVAMGDPAAYDVLTWTGPCADEHLEAFAEMQGRDG